MTGFVKVQKQELDKVYEIYSVARNYEFSTWNEYYPSWDEINLDYETGNLFFLKDNDDIIGVVSIICENELDDASVWQVNGNVCEFARVAVTPKYHGKGYAVKLVSAVIDEIRKRNADAIHILVAVGNIAAYKTYQKLGFVNLGECEMYGGRYYYCEKILKTEE